MEREEDEHKNEENPEGKVDSSESTQERSDEQVNEENQNSVEEKDASQMNENTSGWWCWIKNLLKRLWNIWKGKINRMWGSSSEEETASPLMLKKIIGGYFWSGASKIHKPEDMDAILLTHVYYAFLEVEEDGTLSLQNEDRAINLGFPDGLIKLKRTNPTIKVLFSCVSKKDSFSIVVADESKRKLFVQSAIDTISKWCYDGLDLDWEFPKEHDKENFINLLRELNEEFKQHKFLLAAAVRAIPIYDGSGYDIPEMVKYLDIINVMTYDYYGSWSKHTGPNSPLFPSSQDSAYERKYLNVEASIKNWIEAGAPKEKLCLGIPFYGRSFTLQDKNVHGIHAPVTGGGKPAASTYYQIMTNYKDWPTVWNDEQKTPYKYHEDHWIGYDDDRSVTEKVNYALSQDLAGVFVWQLAGDDMSGDISGVKQFLLTTIHKEIVSA